MAEIYREPLPSDSEQARFEKQINQLNKTPGLDVRIGTLNVGALLDEVAVHPDTRDAIGAFCRRNKLTFVTLRDTEAHAMPLEDSDIEEADEVPDVFLDFLNSLEGLPENYENKSPEKPSDQTIEQAWSLVEAIAWQYNTILPEDILTRRHRDDTILGRSKYDALSDEDRSTLQTLFNHLAFVKSQLLEMDKQLDKESIIEMKAFFFLDRAQSPPAILELA